MRNQQHISILLILILVIPTIGMFAWLQAQKHAVRKEVKHQLIAQTDRSELVLLKFHPNEMDEKLEWEHSREFEFDDEMYDVVEREVRGDTTYFYCWWDHEETALNRQLNELLTLALGQNKDHHQNKQQLQQFFLSLYCSENEVDVPIDEVETDLSAKREFHWKSRSTKPLVPPPDLS